MRNAGPQLLRALGLALAASAAAHAESISGVCHDGSIFIVQHESQIPCSRAKQVEPGEMPPVRPSYLPKPHTWQIWNEAQDPNNPYNVVDQARQVRELGAGQAAGGSGAAPGAAASALQSAAVAPAEAAPRRDVGPLQLGLGEQDLADLFAIVELSQERAPARFERETAGGEGVSRVAFARSRAFEERLAAAHGARGAALSAQVLLFAARSNRAQEFWPNFTFVQEHITYQPDATSDRQLGVLQGRLGQLSEGEVVLGYVVLPPTIDLDAREVEIYWDDRHTRARF
ncbi:MAG: hypothetical protein FJ091_14730 [Deltaproteobacteria bacterium]|nr:hypothetical protein [Deltaproteobacteria bacterium]